MSVVINLLRKTDGYDGRKCTVKIVFYQDVRLGFVTLDDRSGQEFDCIAE